MTLRKVPGFKDYMAEDQALKNLAVGPGMVRVMMAQGRELAGNANEAGHSTYEAQLSTLRVGPMNETRVSVNIVETEPDQEWRDARNRVLLGVIEKAQKRDKR